MALSLPLVILYIYAALSIVTFIVYAYDKSAAKAGRWRVSESNLHLLALAGGWPGAMLAQQLLRHKTIKRPFRVTFWVTVFLNCVALAWLFTDAGRVYVDRLF